MCHASDCMPDRLPRILAGPFFERDFIARAEDQATFVRLFQRTTFYARPSSPTAAGTKVGTTVSALNHSPCMCAFLCVGPYHTYAEGVVIHPL